MVRWKSIKSHLWQSIKPYKYLFYATFLLFATAEVIGYVMLPVILEQVIDIISTSAPGTTGAELIQLIYKYGWLLVVQFIAYRLFDVAMVHAQIKIMRNLINQAYDAIMQHGYSFFANNFTGSLVAKAKRYRSSFEVVHDQLVFQFCTAAVVATGMIVVLSRRNLMLAGIFTIWTILFVIVSFSLAWYRLRYDIAEAEADSNVTAHLADTITNALSVKTFAREHVEQNRFFGSTREQEKALGRSYNFSVIIWFVQSVFVIAFEFGSIYYSVLLWNQGQISTGVIVLIQAYSAAIIGKVWQLGRALTRVMKSVTDMDEMVQIMDEPMSVVELGNAEDFHVTQGHIHIDNITFAYEGAQVFNNFSLDLRPGEKIGLVGHSGSGKSTLTKLLLRFEDVQEGSIRIDGRDIRSITKNSLREAIAYVPQEPLLFHRSIEENIGYGRPSASTEEIKQAAQRAHAHLFIENLPQGYDTLVGERGIKLSGGERQRVAIARAMIKDAPILILDEATSSLDATSERLIQEGFEELMKGRTTIVIAHRLATVQKMDRIIVLKQGRIVEQGSHQELIAKGGEYYQLYTHQQL